MGLFSKKSIGGALGAAVGAITGNPSAGYSIGSGIGGLFDKSNKSTSAQKTWDTQFSTMSNWEKEKMQNAHQWEMQDLLATGLNPALTAGGTGAVGSGSPNPTEWQGAQENNQINSGLKLIDIANNFKKIEAEVGNINADTTTKMLNNETIEKYGNKQAKAQLANTLINSQLAQANTALATEQRATEQVQQWLMRGQTAQAQEQAGKTREETKGLARANRFDEKHPNLYGWHRGYGYIRPTIQDIGMSAGMILSAKKVGGLAEALSKSKITERYNKNGKFTGASKSWYE